MNIDLTQRLAAVELVLTILLACQSEDLRRIVRDAAANSLRVLQAPDEVSDVIRSAVDDIIERALSARR